MHPCLHVCMSACLQYISFSAREMALLSRQSWSESDGKLSWHSARGVAS
jgi:hypothetical protein